MQCLDLPYNSPDTYFPCPRAARGTNRQPTESASSLFAAVEGEVHHKGVFYKILTQQRNRPVAAVLGAVSDIFQPTYMRVRTVRLAIRNREGSKLFMALVYPQSQAPPNIRQNIPTDDGHWKRRTCEDTMTRLNNSIGAVKAGKVNVGFSRCLRPLTDLHKSKIRNCGFEGY